MEPTRLPFVPKLQSPLGRVWYRRQVLQGSTLPRGVLIIRL